MVLPLFHPPEQSEGFFEQLSLVLSLDNGELEVRQSRTMKVAMDESEVRATVVPGAKNRFPKSAKLLRHADFQRAYKHGKRHFAAQMTVFYLLRAADREIRGPRVGLTVGRVLGGAVERNRIKRRFREAVRFQLHQLTRDVDLVINPKKTALTAPFAELQSQVGHAFQLVDRASLKPFSKIAGESSKS